MKAGKENRKENRKERRGKTLYAGKINTGDAGETAREEMTGKRNIRKRNIRKRNIRRRIAGKRTIREPGLRPAAYALAFWLLLTGIVLPAPAYASEKDHKTESGELTFYPQESSASADSTVKGYIKVELISVEMPAGGLEFQVDTEAPFGMESPGEQIQSPGICIRNRSVVPVRLEIAQVADIRDEDVHFSKKFSDGADQSFRLVDRIAGVGEPGTAILVLGLSGKEYSEAAFEQDAIVPGKKDIFLTDIPAEEERTLELYGKVAPDFYGSYQFTVRPTLKISAVQATPAD